MSGWEEMRHLATNLYTMCSRPSMMRSGVVALRCADERVIKAFDRTIDPIPFVFNPGTKNETTVMAHVVVTNSDAATMLLVE
jgi:hypothetical protein